MENHPTETTPKLNEIFPLLSQKELKRAEKNLEDYLDIALEVYERIRNDPESYSQFKALTVGKVNSTVKPSLESA